MHGGMIADVRLVELSDGRRVVAKEARNTPLEIEARMLRFLRMHTSLLVPEVLESSDELLVLEYVEGGSQWGHGTETHAAELLAGLHVVTPGSLLSHGPSSGSAFGFYFDTLIGPFPQRNDWTEEWPEFFRTQRLEPMLEECLSRDRLDDSLVGRLRLLMGDLDRLLDHSPEPGLVHGDIWSGNVLAANGRLTAFLDPALYFADPEVELAFIELFSTFGPMFWRRYEELRGIDPGYRSVRRDVYQVYPLLVHVALFGGTYVAGVEERLERLGY